MVLDSKQPRTVLSARHLCVSAFRLGWTIRPDSWLRFQEAISNCIRAHCSCSMPSSACSLLWGKKCLTDCRHYSIQCILTGACPLKKKSFVLFCFCFFLRRFVGLEKSWKESRVQAQTSILILTPRCSSLNVPVLDIVVNSLSLS